MSNSLFKPRTFWTDREIKLLLEVWRTNLSALRGVKRNRKIYNKMATQLQDVAKLDVLKTPEEIHMKINNLTKQYRKEKSKMEGGSSPSRWPYFYSVGGVIGSSPPPAKEEPSVPENQDSVLDASTPPAPTAGPAAAHIPEVEIKEEQAAILIEDPTPRNSPFEDDGPEDPEGEDAPSSPNSEATPPPTKRRRRGIDRVRVMSKHKSPTLTELRLQLETERLHAMRSHFKRQEALQKAFLQTAIERERRFERIATEMLAVNREILRMLKE